MPISIDEVDSDDYNASNVKEIVYSEDPEYCEEQGVDINMDVEQVQDLIMCYSFGVQKKEDSLRHN